MSETGILVVKWDRTSRGSLAAELRSIKKGVKVASENEKGGFRQIVKRPGACFRTSTCTEWWRGLEGARRN